MLSRLLTPFMEHSMGLLTIVKTKKSYILRGILSWARYLVICRAVIIFKILQSL